MTNPFLSTPEAAQFWREQQQSCEEARRLLCKTPEFAQFLAAGGTLAVVPIVTTIINPLHLDFAAMLKDGDTVVCIVPFWCDEYRVFLDDPKVNAVARLTAWLTEARDGAKAAPEETFGFTFQS